MSTHVSLHGLAKERGQGFLKIKRWLEYHGVHPAFPPEQVAVTMYRRDQIPNVPNTRLFSAVVVMGEREH